MSRYIDLDKLLEHCGGECLYCPFCLQEHGADYCVLEYDMPTIDIVHCEGCRWRDDCSQTVGNFEKEVNTVLRWCSDGVRRDNDDNLREICQSFISIVEETRIDNE